MTPQGQFHDPDQFNYRIRGKLEGGLFGTRGFEDEGEIQLNLPNAGNAR